MVECKIKVIGDHGTYDSIEEWQSAERQKSSPTLRDRFAMAALTGILSESSSYTFVGAAQAAYEQADAMLQVRQKGKQL